MEYAEKTIAFVQSNVPYGSCNYNNGLKALTKFARILNKASSAERNNITWLNVTTNPHALPWDDEEVKGVKASIAAELMGESKSGSGEVTLDSPAKVIQLAKSAFAYGTGRCVSLAALVHVYNLKNKNYSVQNRNGQPAIYVLMSLGEITGHALNIIGGNLGCKLSSDTVGKYKYTFSPESVFCDPWAGKIGVANDEFEQHICMVNQEINKQSSYPEIIEQKIFYSEELAELVEKFEWPIKEQQENFAEIEERFKKFQEGNVILKAKFDKAITAVNEALGKAFIKKYITPGLGKWEYCHLDKGGVGIKFPSFLMQQKDCDWFAVKLKTIVPEKDSIHFVAKKNATGETRYELQIDIKNWLKPESKPAVSNSSSNFTPLFLNK